MRDPSRVRVAVLIVAAMTALRLGAAATLPLTFDEAYYWTWSRSLAGGYYDHPPLIPGLIRLGTMVAGDGTFGVRWTSVLLTVPMSWATYRTAAMLFRSERVGATAMILLNVTIIAWTSTVTATPDAPLMAASCLAMLSLAKFLDTREGAWWLAIGASIGAALLSKYSALFFGPSILIWLLLVPDLRRWLRSPWPYLGAIVTLVMFSPTLLWNAQHEWASFIKQFGRVGADAFRPRFIAGYVGTQFLFLTPAVSILAASGLYAMARQRIGVPGAAAMLAATIGVVVAYFFIHALHEEVHPDWLCQVYPAFAIAGAVAVERVRWSARWQRVVGFLDRWALPGAAAMLGALYIHVQTGVLTGYRKDEGSRLVGIGFREVADEIDALRARFGARCVLAPDYGTTSWLAFYLPKGSCVAQRSDRIRWVNTTEPDPALLRGKLLLVDTPPIPPLERDAFASLETVATLARKRGPAVVQQYVVSLADGARADPLGRRPKP